MLVAREALTTMANKGYKHCDLAWRHVGLLPYKNHSKSSRVNTVWSVTPILIDLSDSKKLSLREKKNIEKVVDEGLKSLDSIAY